MDTFKFDAPSLKFFTILFLFEVALILCYAFGANYHEDSSLAIGRWRGDRIFARCDACCAATKVRRWYSCMLSLLSPPVLSPNVLPSPPFLLPPLPPP